MLALADRQTEALEERDALRRLAPRTPAFGTTIDVCPLPELPTTISTDEHRTIVDRAVARERGRILATIRDLETECRNQAAKAGPTEALALHASCAVLKSLARRVTR